MAGTCLHYNKSTGKCGQKKCSYNKRDKKGRCICMGKDYVGNRKKDNHNYLCSRERII